MKPKFILTAVTALLAGVLIGFTLPKFRPSDTFTVTGRRVTETAPSAPEEVRGLIDINGASFAELGDLPGIGPALARRIIDFREANGPFAEVDDLLSVSGIGEKTLEGLRKYAYCG